MLTVHPLGLARSALTNPVGVTRTVLETGRFLRVALPVVRRASGARILFQWHGGIGDAVCTFPAVLVLRQRFPGAAIVYRVPPHLAEVTRMGRVADVVVTNYIGQARRWLRPVVKPQVLNLAELRPHVNEVLT
jgi:hypothetical protein